MPGKDLLRDGRDLAPAAFDSCDAPDPFSLNLLERAAVCLELRFLSAQRLPAPDDDVDVLRIEFNAVADALGQFRGRQRCAGTQKRLVHQFAAAEMIQD